MNIIHPLLRLPPRSLFLALAALCISLLGAGLYLQHGLGIEPCPMCIMQRYALLLVGLIALVAGVHGVERRGVRVYAGLIVLAALCGAGIAARQSWMQLFPPAVPECGPGLEFMLDSFPLGQALPMIFRGAGDCARVDWSFLGLSLANWSLLCFAATIVYAGWLLRRRT